MAPVINALKRSQSIEVKICVTGQHRKMLDQVLSTFEIYPEYDLSIMEPNQTLGDVTARVLAGVTKVLNMVDKSEYKRRQSPPGIKITPKAFGRDRRMPITNKYK